MSLRIRFRHRVLECIPIEMRIAVQFLALPLCHSARDLAQAHVF